MSTRVRSYSKINLGLAIGPVRPDRFHSLSTLYQTLELHDLVTVEARRLGATWESQISMSCNHAGVPTDARNTAWRMVERALAALGIAAEVHIDIDKRLPVQGGLGAGSANAVAALIGLERELGLDTSGTGLSGSDRLALAAEIGSDVPLFLLGGSVLGLGRGEEVYPMPDLPSYECVVAVPAVSVSTPQAFRDWDALVTKTPKSQKRDTGHPGEKPTSQERDPSTGSVQVVGHTAPTQTFASPTQAKTRLEWVTQTPADLTGGDKSDNVKRLSRSFAASLGSPHSSGVSPQRGDLAENTLLALVRTGIENDFESVVFPQYPLLGQIKRILAVPDPETPEQSALYAALSGSGSAVFGLYATTEAAKAAHRRLEAEGITGYRTRMLPRAKYWRDMIESA